MLPAVRQGREADVQSLMKVRHAQVENDVRSMMPPMAAMALAACSQLPDAVTEREIAGRYDGVGYGDPVPQPRAIQLTLRGDRSFIGNLIGGPGTYPVTSGRWTARTTDGSGACTRILLAPDRSQPIVACLARQPDGAICLNWSADVQTGCPMRKSSQEK